MACAHDGRPRLNTCGIGDGAQQVADQAVEFGVGDEMSGLHIAQRAAEHAREIDQRGVAAG
jgi:hypothetical protein